MSPNTKWKNDMAELVVEEKRMITKVLILKHQLN